MALLKPKIIFNPFYYALALGLITIPEIFLYFINNFVTIWLNMVTNSIIYIGCKKLLSNLKTSKKGGYMVDTLFNLCKPRDSVFDETKRDDTLDLSNLNDNTIDADEFFKETYVTDGMKHLFDTAFKRFEGKGASGLVRLTQAMGGGKSHNMVALGLLARYPDFRKGIYKNESPKTAGKEIRLVSYTGRESDIKHGIWGEIAKQLGKTSVFKDYYTPLSAPGQSAWINLLKGEPLLILLDELPPYLEYAKAVPVSATGTLADITTTALANLFNALGKPELHNVCLVVSDLKATYESGSELLQSSFKNLDNELSRSCVNIEPVGTTTDDLYHILKTRLFEKIAGDTEIQKVALGYRDAVKQAKQMQYTNLTPEKIFAGVKDTYPFHPSIKDLFARFRENANFQQTRGFIRLTREMVKGLYTGQSPKAKTNYLINAYDMDLNDTDIFAIIRDIKSKLANAISHDIASNGKAVAEDMDNQLGNSDMSDLTKLILVSSLGDATNALLGLSEMEIMGWMARPGKDITGYKGILEDYKTKAWYLYADKDNRLMFKDIKNINAELITNIEGLDNETARQEIKNVLGLELAPELGDCYKQVLIFPAIDEVVLSKDNVTLIVFQPDKSSSQLSEDLKGFYDNARYKNRVMFLTGQRNQMDNLLLSAKRYKAIQKIIERLEDEKVPEKDSQFKQANDIYDQLLLSLLQAARDTFTTLHYPTKNIVNETFKMQFQNNSYKVEEQIKKILINSYKYETEHEKDSFRSKFETRIFTSSPMSWNDLKERAAMQPTWSWHHPTALDDMKNAALKKGIWVEIGGLIEKNPPLPTASVLIRETDRDLTTGTVTLKLTPQNGDTVHYEINANATTGSSKVTNLSNFQSDELYLSFLCVDSTGKHNSGPPVTYKNTITLQFQRVGIHGQEHIELRAAPSRDVEIRYTTDGSAPKSGGVYKNPFAVPANSKFIQAVAYNDQLGITSEVLVISNIIIGGGTPPVVVDDHKPLILNHKLSSANTKETYETLQQMENYKAGIQGITLNIFETVQGQQKGWAELSFDKNTVLCPKMLAEEFDNLRVKFFDNKTVEASLNVEKVHFKAGIDFKDWVSKNNLILDNFRNKFTQ